MIGSSATNLCTHCGWCIDACHIYKATKDPTKSPVAKAERIRKVMKGDHDMLSKIFPYWTGAEKLTEEELNDWVNVAYRDCTLCERCVINCPMGVETPQILAAARGALTAVHKNPEILDDLAGMALFKEEDMDITRDDFYHTIHKLESQVQQKLNDPHASIPLEVEADMLYVPLSGSHTIVPAAILFNAAKSSWVMSMYEASNYGLFMADTPLAKKIVNRILKEARRLNVKEIIVSECGHAYGVLKWEAPKWFGDAFDFKVRSVLEVYDEFLAKGLIKVDSSKITGSVTYHDPCNIGRKGGIFEEPRRAIKAAVNDFREMRPSRVESFCCGGGGGMVANDDWREDRLLYGKVKAEQIKATGADKVVTACDNCLHQIKELSDHYGLNVETSNVSQLLVEALVVD